MKNQWLAFVLGISLSLGSAAAVAFDKCPIFNICYVQYQNCLNAGGSTQQFCWNAYIDCLQGVCG